MQRNILGFGRDDEGDWTAHLACGHNRHVRHRPPLINRPWVVHAAGRAAWLGRSFDCLRCDRLEWPVRILEHRPPDRAFALTADDAHNGMLAYDGSPHGLWREIEIEAGSALLHIAALGLEQPLGPGTNTAIPPALAFRVQALATLRGHIRAYRLI
ncbi:hypothetical protein S4A8_09730 [Salinisphaera sp. S4-8]|uniref:DUF3565 domain-containing protein n=1 Tax=Salinisphaera sp. S4-8 TaxID=633357 RepID=UPI00333EF312